MPGGELGKFPVPCHGVKVCCRVEEAERRLLWCRSWSAVSTANHLNPLGASVPDPPSEVRSVSRGESLCEGRRDNIQVDTSI